MTQQDEKPGRATRRLIRGTDRATMATALVDGGCSYASLAMVACDQGAAPLLLLSDLAEHTKNIAADPRGSLLYDGTAGLENPLTGLRATLVGRFEKSDDEAALARYIRRHPDAAAYAGFGDFNLYCMTVERVHVVAGFGAIHWLDVSDVLPADGRADALAAAEHDIVDHMNADHGDAVALYARALLGLAGDGWILTGIDPDGCDLRAGGETARIEFDAPVTSPEAARETFVRLVGAARQSGGGTSP